MLQQQSQKPRQILKQTSKIKSICDYLQKKSFQFTTSTHSISSIITELKQKLDQILYSAVQIQKITNTLIKDDEIFNDGQLGRIGGFYGKEEARGKIKGKDRNIGVRVEAEELELRLDDGRSDSCNQALQRIHRYTRKLERFEKKMGILIHQANFNRIRSKSRIHTEQYQLNSNPLKTNKFHVQTQQKQSTTKKSEKALNMSKKSKKQFLNHYSSTKKNEKIDANNNDNNGSELQQQQYKMGSRQQSQIRMIDKEIVQIAELIKRIQNEKIMQQGDGDDDGDEEDQ